jgi:hypothetical protein
LGNQAPSWVTKISACKGGDRHRQLGSRQQFALRIQRFPVRKEGSESVVGSGERIEAEATRDTGLILLDQVAKEIALCDQLRVRRVKIQRLAAVLELAVARFRPCMEPDISSFNEWGAAATTSS